MNINKARCTCDNPKEIQQRKLINIHEPSLSLTRAMWKTWLMSISKPIDGALNTVPFHSLHLSPRRNNPSVEWRRRAVEGRSCTDVQHLDEESSVPGFNRIPPSANRWASEMPLLALMYSVTTSVTLLCSLRIIEIICPESILMLQ